MQRECSLREVSQAVHLCLVSVPDRLLRPFLSKRVRRIRTAEGADVAPCAKGASSPRQHEHPHTRIARRLVKDLAHPTLHGSIERIPGFRAVERNCQDALIIEPGDESGFGHGLFLTQTALTSPSRTAAGFEHGGT